MRYRSRSCLGVAGGVVLANQDLDTLSKSLQVGTGNISMFRNPGKEEYVVVTFEQDYRSSNHSGQMKKRQYSIKEGGRWKIVYEGAA